MSQKCTRNHIVKGSVEVSKSEQSELDKSDQKSHKVSKVAKLPNAQSAFLYKARRITCSSYNIKHLNRDVVTKQPNRIKLKDNFTAKIAQIGPNFRLNHM